MKRTLIILAVAVLYVIAVSSALRCLPFADTPELFKSLFTNSCQGAIAWMKFRHTVVVVIISGFLALLLIHYDNRKAQVNAFVVAALAVLWGGVFRLAIIGVNNLTWGEITDYITIGAAIPVFVAIRNGRSRGINSGARPN